LIAGGVVGALAYSDRATWFDSQKRNELNPNDINRNIALGGGVASVGATIAIAGAAVGFAGGEE
jgi:hypothetical protein